MYMQKATTKISLMIAHNIHWMLVKENEKTTTKTATK